ncbi:YwlC protein [Crucibulum laeve]|uniref:Threonylcarbamoyl-AMP synthase n=1 Tax=Crucibulum laeve TaxID=68775 RepID=A0A5C3MG21_9AGAR|nr:YwlC protein [Crucibulum laeve]
MSKMVSEHAKLYRNVLRELRRSVASHRKVNRTVAVNFRSIVENMRKSESAQVRHDLENAALFLRSQREHKAYARFMTPVHPTTRLLKCDPACISFLASSDLPSISSQETSQALATAALHLQNLETVVFPTETVYGLGALALDASAASKIFSTKGRPPDNPLIVHVSSFAMLRTLLPPDYMLSEAYQALMKHFWPGALTLLFPRNADVVPTIISANQPTVAIRMPSHPVARALIAVANAPLAAPSANTSGKPSPTRAEHVQQDLEGKTGIILDGGPCGVGVESTVVDGLHEDGNIRVLRPGGVTVEEIERVLEKEMTGHIPKVLVHRRDFRDEAIEHAPTTPGMKYRHYSPSVPVTLLFTSSSPPENTRPMTITSFINALIHSKLDEDQCKIGMMATDESKIWDHLHTASGIEWHRYSLGSVTEPAAAAHLLFDGLLTLDRAGVDQILIEEVHESREGLAVMNRVRKAAGESIWLTID